MTDPSTAWNTRARDKGVRFLPVDPMADDRPWSVAAKLVIGGAAFFAALFIVCALLWFHP